MWNVWLVFVIARAVLTDREKETTKLQSTRDLSRCPEKEKFVLLTFKYIYIYKSFDLNGDFVVVCREVKTEVVRLTKKNRKNET